MSDWYVLSALDELGPMSREELGERARRGEIDPDTLVREGKASWQPASDVPGLCSAKPKRAKTDEAGKSGKSGKKQAIAKKAGESGKQISSVRAAIDAALEADEAAAKRAASPDKEKAPPTITALSKPVTKAEVRQEAQDLVAELAPSLPYWLMGLGFGFWLVTLKASPWSPTVVVHYGALLAGLAGVAIFARMSWGREMKWIRPVSTVAVLGLLVLWGSVDWHVHQYTAPDGAIHRDTTRRWNGQILSRRRAFRQPGVEFEAWGPTNATGQPHGHWQTRWTEPEANNALDAKGNWFWNGALITEAEWEARRKAEGS